MTQPSGLDVSELADHCGRLAWVAGALFELEGRWSADIGTPGAVEHLATNSRFHGWHATLWTELLPDSPALEGSSRISAPPGWEAALAVVRELGDEGDDAARLALLYRGLVGRAAVMVGELGRLACGPGDGPAARVVGLVAADQRSDLVGGIGWLTNALGDQMSVESAARAVEALDRSFANL